MIRMNHRNNRHRHRHRHRHRRHDDCGHVHGTRCNKSIQIRPLRNTNTHRNLSCPARGR